MNGGLLFLMLLLYSVNQKIHHDIWRIWEKEIQYFLKGGGRLPPSFRYKLPDENKT